MFLRKFVDYNTSSCAYSHTKRHVSAHFLTYKDMSFRYIQHLTPFLSPNFPLILRNESSWQIPNRSSQQTQVRERSPANLGSAHRIALLQLEVWTKDVDRIRNEQPQQFERKAREVTRTESLAKMVKEQRKQVTELQNQLARVTLRLNAYDSIGRPAAERHVAERSG